MLYYCSKILEQKGFEKQCVFAPSLLLSMFRKAETSYCLWKKVVVLLQALNPTDRYTL